MRIGVFGASFNPPTRGHEDVINQALSVFDEILLVPSVAHPFEKKSIALEERLNMLKLFIAPWKNRVKIFNIEPAIQAKNPDKNKVYTFEVLSEIEAYYQSQQQCCELRFILGPDNADPVVWKKFYRYADIEKRWGVWVAKENLLIHSTMVREAVKTLKQSLSEPMANYIIEHNLYGDPNRKLSTKSPTLTITLVIFSIIDKKLMVMIDTRTNLILGKAGLLRQEASEGKQMRCLSAEASERRRKRTQPTQHKIKLERVEAGSLPVATIDPSVDDSLEQAAKRLFKDRLGIETSYLEQVQTIGFNNRVVGEWSVSVNYYGLINAVAMDQKEQWVALSDLATIDLALDHRKIIESCLQRFQNKSLYTSLPIFLLPTEFTLTELQRTYETVLGFKMEKKSFRRRLLDAGFLEETGNIRRASHRPAQLYRLAHPKPYFFARIIEGVRENR